MADITGIFQMNLFLTCVSIGTLPEHPHYVI